MIRLFSTLAYNLVYKSTSFFAHQAAEQFNPVILNHTNCNLNIRKKMSWTDCSLIAELIQLLVKGASALESLYCHALKITSGDLSGADPGGAKGALPPPPSPQQIAPPNSQARIQGAKRALPPPPPPGAKRALAPPPLTKSWIRLCLYPFSSTCGNGEVTRYFMPVECDLWVASYRRPGYSLPMARAIT